MSTRPVIAIAANPALDEAIEYYNKALDSFFSIPDKLSEGMIPRGLKSFEAIDKVLTTKRDWKGQERAYRDMIKRLPKGGNPMFHKLQVGLFDGLGEIYRSRLKHYQSATQAFEIAQQMGPKNEMRPDGTDRAEILAQLYLVAGPDYTDKAVGSTCACCAKSRSSTTRTRRCAASTWTRTS